jgi:hypothetical protein
MKIGEDVLPEEFDDIDENVGGSDAKLRLVSRLAE